MIVLKSDGRDFARLGNLYAAAGKDAPRAVRLAVREVGMLARTGMRRAVRAELGPQKAIARHVNRRIIGALTSGGAGAAYTISAKGVIPLKFLKSVQTPAGVMLPGINRQWVGGGDHLPKAFEAKSGSSGQAGNAAKRRATLGGRIVYRASAARKSLRTVRGVLINRVFLAGKPRKAFKSAAEKLPPRLARLLFAAVEGKLRAHRGSRGR